MRTFRGVSAPTRAVAPRPSRCSPSPPASTGSSSTWTARPAPLLPTRVPAMRKDFLVDPYQVLEARLAGAGGILVILRMLSRPQVDALLGCAREQGMFVLLEAFDAATSSRCTRLVQVARRRHGPPGGHQLPRPAHACRSCRGACSSCCRCCPREVPRVAESGVASERGRTQHRRGRLRDGADRQRTDARRRPAGDWWPRLLAAGRSA